MTSLYHGRYTAVNTAAATQPTQLDRYNRNNGWYAREGPGGRAPPKPAGLTKRTGQSATPHAPSAPQHRAPPVPAYAPPRSPSNTPGSTLPPSTPSMPRLPRRPGGLCPSARGRQRGCERRQAIAPQSAPPARHRSAEQPQPGSAAWPARRRSSCPHVVRRQPLLETWTTTVSHARPRYARTRRGCAPTTNHQPYNHPSAPTPAGD